MKGLDAGTMFACVIFGLILGSLIGAMLLRAAVALYNRLVGGESADGAVPSPSFRTAMGIALSTNVANFFVGIVIGIAVSEMGRADPQPAGVDWQARARSLQILSQLIAMPIGFFVAAGMLCTRLPTTFGRASLVALCYVLISILIVAVLAVAVLGVMFFTAR